MIHPWPQIRRSLAALAITVLIACSPPPPTTNPVRSLEVEQFDNLISAKEFNGLVAVFASWCPPCREELHDLAKLDRKARSENARIIAVSMDQDDPQAVQRVVNQLGLPFPVYYVGLPLAQKYRIVGVPTLLVVRQGQIVEKVLGQQSSSQLAAKLKRVVSGAS